MYILYIRFNYKQIKKYKYYKNKYSMGKAIGQPLVSMLEWHLKHPTLLNVFRVYKVFTIGATGRATVSLCQSLKEGSSQMAQDSNLIPMADTYLDNNMNIMLIGLHGTGKTQSIFDLAKSRGIKVKYYSCATLDPYTDLVGVPVPQKDENGVDFLKMIRPREVDEAELIFFDEFNRADSKTINAVFEIIQFRSINGEPLPNLRCCWAAMNPPDKDYNVEELDPALMDRFDAFIEMKPKPSVQYMSQKMPKEVAKALKDWWDEQNRKKRDFKDYVSPRRLEKIGLVYMATKNQQAVKYALPPGSNLDVQKLIYNLEVATGKRIETIKDTIGSNANADFQYTTGGLVRQRTEIASYLNANPNELETHKSVIDVFKSAAVGSDTLIKSYGPILDNLSPALLEGYFNSLSSSKRSQIRNAYQNTKGTKTYSSLEKVLAKGARSGNWDTDLVKDANVPF